MRVRLLMFYVITFLLIQSLFMFSIQLLSYIDIQFLIGNNLISERASVIIFDDDNNIPTIDEIIKINDQNQTSIFSKIEVIAPFEVYGYLGNGNLKYLRQIVSGNFIDTTNSNKPKYQIVIGESVEVTDNNIVFFGDEYQVINVISSKISSQLNNTIFINLNHYQNKIDKIYIDGKNQKDINKTTNTLLEEYNCRLIYENSFFVTKTILDEYKPIIYLNLAMVVFLIVIFIIFLFLYYQNEIKIKYIVGFNVREIMHDIIKEITILSIIGTLIFSFFYTIIYNMYLNFLIFNLIYSILFSFFVYIMFCTIFYVYLKLLLR